MKNDNDNGRATMKGRQMARALDWRFGRSGNGTDQLAIMFGITKGQHEGRRIVWRGYFTEASLNTTVRALRALGWEGDDLSALGDLSAREVELTIEQEQDQDGEIRDRVRWVNSVAVTLADPMDGDEVRSLADRMAARIAALRSSSSSGSSSQPSNAADDDPIPF